MITDSFEANVPAIMGPGDFYGEQRHICDICILTFSQKILNNVLEEFECAEAATLSSVNGSRTAYTFLAGDKRVGIFMVDVGSAMTSSDVIELNWLVGATKFIMFGSAGSLNSDITTGKYVIPTHAYRDEGMSYHYAPPSDYIEIKNSARVRQIMDELRLPAVEGKVWTTDAFYRETRSQMQKRQSEGCIAVEMELAGVQAVCDFYGFELYDFLVTGDVLDKPQYSKGNLRGANHDLDKLYIALEIAERI